MSFLIEGNNSVLNDVSRIAQMMCTKCGIENTSIVKGIVHGPENKRKETEKKFMRSARDELNKCERYNVDCGG